MLDLMWAEIDPNIDTMIYSPNVHVIRDDNYSKLNDDTFMINVISAPAVDNRKISPFLSSEEIMERRIRKIISLAIDRRNDVVILGAFGCGIFKNDPKIVSQIFKKILVDERLKDFFKLVVFPIYKSEVNCVSICTSVVSRNNIYQRTYHCDTCYAYNICEICARVCHKGHKILIGRCSSSIKHTCLCKYSGKCKCWPISNFYGELYDKFKAIKGKQICCNSAEEFNEDEDDYIDKNEYKIKDVECLKCTLDLAGFNSMWQPMYQCRDCKVDICQSYAIRCHRGHSLNFKGFKNDASCHCFEMADCCSSIC